jgi:hypothetical protein
MAGAFVEQRLLIPKKDMETLRALHKRADPAQRGSFQDFLTKAIIPVGARAIIYSLNARAEEQRLVKLPGEILAGIPAQWQ